jgi:hypothetical protein
MEYLMNNLARITTATADTFVGVAEIGSKTVTMLHPLLNAGIHRGVVIEQKSEGAAALSAMNGRHTLAKELAELEQFELEHPELLAKADVFLANYRKQRSAAQSDVYTSVAHAVEQALKTTKSSKKAR